VTAREGGGARVSGQGSGADDARKPSGKGCEVVSSMADRRCFDSRQGRIKSYASRITLKVDLTEPESPSQEADVLLSTNYTVWKYSWPYSSCCYLAEYP